MTFDPLKQIMDADDSKTELVECPEWKMTIRCECQKGERKAEFDDFVKDNGITVDEKVKLPPIQFRSIVLSSVITGCKNGDDEFHDWQLTYEQAEQIVREKSSLVVERLFDAGLPLLGLGSKDRQELEKKRIEESPTRMLAWRILFANPGRWSTYKEVLRDLDCDDLQDYESYFELHPFGIDVQQKQMATANWIAALAAGMREIEIDDFMPGTAKDDEPEELTEQEKLSRMPGGAEFLRKLEAGEVT